MMYEKEGFCPGNHFFRFIQEELELDEDTEKAEKIMDILGSRVNYMVYDRDHEAYGTIYPSIVELLLGDTCGLEIAQMLSRIIPECQYSKIGKKILIKDVISPFQMGGGLRPLTEKLWSFPNREGCYNVNCPIMRKDNRNLYCGEKFVVNIEDNDDDVTIWMFKYPEK